MDTSQILSPLGFALEKDQPHISGERFLLAPNKQVLVGRQRGTDLRVIIKISHLVKGKQEIRQEKKVRDILMSFAFSRKVMFFPKELFFGLRSGHLILVTEFITQDKVFIALPLKEQQAIILHSLKVREALRPKNLKTFGILNGRDYLDNFKHFKANIGPNVPMQKAWEILKLNEKDIDKYGNFLVHGDFVPHNFRIQGKSLYVLDYSAFHFGNKYEEWARLVNYMTIHNPSLEKKLKQHILKRRGKNDYAMLRLMRIYKIGFLLDFYTKSLPKTSKDLRALTMRRIEFWTKVLQSVIDDKPLNKKVLKAYLGKRDKLRSKEEKRRQREFTLA